MAVSKAIYLAVKTPLYILRYFNLLFCAFNNSIRSSNWLYLIYGFKHIFASMPLHHHQDRVTVGSALA